MAFENSFEEPCRSGERRATVRSRSASLPARFLSARHLLTGFRFWLSSVSAAS